MTAQCCYEPLKKKERQKSHGVITSLVLNCNIRRDVERVERKEDDITIQLVNSSTSPTIPSTGLVELLS